MKLVLREEGSRVAEELWQASERVVTSRLTYPEARAALAAAIRAGRVRGRGRARARSSLELAWESLGVIDLDGPIGIRAGALAETHRLRGSDAVQLASAMALGGVLATWDRDLSRAAREAGLAVAP